MPDPTPGLPVQYVLLLSYYYSGPSPDKSQKHYLVLGYNKRVINFEMVANASQRALFITPCSRRFSRVAQFHFLEHSSVMTGTYPEIWSAGA